jgi:Xaa-Pro dipeptidase
MKSKKIILSRQDKFRNTMQDADIDAIVLNPGPSLTYLTGLHFHLSERPIVLFITPNQTPVIVLPDLEIAKVKNLPYPIKSYTYGENPSSWIKAFQNAALVVGRNIKKVGVEPRGLRYLEMQFLEKSFQDSVFISANGIIASLRMFKDEHEIGCMQEAADIAQKALKATLPKIKVGVKEVDIASELSIQLLKQRSNPALPFFPIVSGGPNSANPHASPSDRRLASGDLLVIDYGANVEGYFSDITRTFAIGDVDSEYKKIAEIVFNANQAGRNAVKPGVTASSVDQAARSVIENAGYGEYFFHRTGHGLGLEGHEEPYIRKDNDLKLEIGMTFTVEPGIYLPGRNGVRIEDDVLVTSDGVLSFTSLPRELITLGA